MGFLSTVFPLFILHSISLWISLLIVLIGCGSKKKKVEDKKILKAQKSRKTREKRSSASAEAVSSNEAISKNAPTSSTEKIEQNLKKKEKSGRPKSSSAAKVPPIQDEVTANPAPPEVATTATNKLETKGAEALADTKTSSTKKIRKENKEAKKDSVVGEDKQLQTAILQYRDDVTQKEVSTKRKMVSSKRRKPKGSVKSSMSKLKNTQKTERAGSKDNLETSTKLNLTVPYEESADRNNKSMKTADDTMENVESINMDDRVPPSSDLSNSLKSKKSKSGTNEPPTNKGTAGKAA